MGGDKLDDGHLGLANDSDFVRQTSTFNEVCKGV